MSAAPPAGASGVGAKRLLLAHDGEVLSTTSAGVVAMPDGKLVVLSPSRSGGAPIPPEAKNTATNGSPR